jgi:hypothetical protein
VQLPVSKADAKTSASDFIVQSGKLIKYQGSSSNVTIPDSVDTVGKSAFENNSKVEHVVIPKSVKRIEAYAFWNCTNLTNVSVGSGMMEISDFAFANCHGLTQMVLPDNIKYIGIDAFQDCVNLTDITIPPETIDIHETSFDGCYRLVIHAEKGSYADKYAQDFYERQKEMPEYEDVDEYNKPDSNEPGIPQESDTVPEQEQEDNSVSQMPEQVGELLGSTHVVGNQAVVFIDNTKPKVLENMEGSTEPNEDVRSEVENTLMQTGTLPKFTIVDGSIVADHAYYRNEKLKDVSIPAGIVQIGQFAFARSAIETVHVPEGVKKIDYGAFYHCDELESVELPYSIENVEPKAFEHTKWMDNFRRRGESDFLISGNVLISYSGEGGDISIPEGVTVIAGEAFLNQTEITAVSLPDSLITIGEGAFEGCRNLIAISFGTKLKQIKDRAFMYCPLDPVILPQTLEEQGLQSFDETVEITYLGEQPTSTHEETAERLSNESYRAYTETSEASDVEVVGLDNVSAFLDSSAHHYVLEIHPEVDADKYQFAYKRLYGNNFAGSIAAYDLKLTDESMIPLKKLGKQSMSIIFTVPNDMKGHHVNLYALDRNGQLELVSFERGLSGDEEQIRFQLNNVTTLAFFDDGTPFEEQELLSEFVNFQSMSRGSQSLENEYYILSFLKWCVGGLAFLTGVFLLYLGRQKKS